MVFGDFCTAASSGARDAQEFSPLEMDGVSRAPSRYSSLIDRRECLNIPICASLEGRFPAQNEGYSSRSSTNSCDTAESKKQETFALETDAEKLGYSSPRSAAKREAPASGKDRKELATAGGRKNTRASSGANPFGAYDNYGSSANNKVESYGTAVKNATTKRELFYYRNAHAGDLRPSANASTPRTEHVIGAGDYSPRRGRREEMDRLQEDFYLHKHPANRHLLAGAGQNYKDNRTQEKVQNVDFPTEMYQRRVCRDQRKKVMENYNKYEAGNGIPGHDEAVNEDIPEWARG